ncbi:MAG TPA: peptidoglycan-binding protein [Phycisphaerae bacterium]|jgi:N-acetylmuramoyl-L-alanine amidase
MSYEYFVQQGDCLSSIAAEFKRLPSTIWDAGENADLKQKRKSSNILMPGDKIVIPDLKTKQIAAPTDQETKFVRQGATCKLRVRFRILDGTKETKLTGEDFALHIAGKNVNGSTDGDGGVRKPLDPTAGGGSIRIRGRSIPFSLGALDPHDSITGLQARLNQAGYNAGAVDGDLGPRTQAALKKFQKDQGLTESGNADQATFDKLKQIYGA